MPFSYIKGDEYKRPFVFKGVPDPLCYRPYWSDFFGILTLYFYILVSIIFIYKREADEFLILYALANIFIRVQSSFHSTAITGSHFHDSEIDP